MNIFSIFKSKAEPQKQVVKGVEPDPELLNAVKSTIKSFVTAENLYEAGIVKIEADLDEVETTTDGEPQIVEALVVKILCAKPVVLKRNSLIHPLRQNLFKKTLTILGVKKFIKLDIQRSSPYDPE